MQPEIKEKALKLIDACKNKQIQLIIYCTLRSNAIQDVLFLHGRYPLDVLNERRQLVGLPPITEKENVIITNEKGGLSPHNFGLAFDCVPIIGGVAHFQQTYSVWKDIGKMGKDLGLAWGGDWTKPTRVMHFQSADF